MADYFAGQRFFDFYSEDAEEEEAEIESAPAVGRAGHREAPTR